MGFFTFFLEKITSCAGFLGSLLKSIFYWHAHWEFILTSKFRYLADSLKSWILEKSDESSTNNSGMELSRSDRSLIYITKWTENGPLRNSSLNRKRARFSQGILVYIQALLRNIQVYSGIIRTLSNPHIFTTFPYSDLWHIQNPVKLRQGKFRTPSWSEQFIRRYSSLFQHIQNLA